MDSDLKWTLEHWRFKCGLSPFVMGQSLAAADFRRGLNQSPGFAEDDLAYFFPMGNPPLGESIGNICHMCIYIYNYFLGPLKQTR